jgi:hypothetical protein
VAIVTRYFGVTAAGAEDGTTWADRAALFSAGNWSTVITGFNFAGSDSLLALIGPGSHTCGQSLAAALFANAPIQANPLILHGCDSSGVALVPSDSGWVSAEGAWSDASLPVIATTTNIQTINLPACILRFLKFTASGRNGQIVGGTSQGTLYEWCQFVQSTSNTSASVFNGDVAAVFRNCVLSVTGSSFLAAFRLNGGTLVENCLLTGVTGSSGIRAGVQYGGAFANANSPASVIGCTIRGFGGNGIGSDTSSAAQVFAVARCTIVGNGGSGIATDSDASQTSLHTFVGNVIAGNGAYGINAQSAGRVVATGNRLRDNTSGNINGIGNYPDNLGNTVSAGTDAAEFVNVAAGDYRIKYGSSLWGNGLGAGDEPASGTSGGVIISGGMGYFGIGVH